MDFSLWQYRIATKMPKHSRSSSIELKSVEDNGIVIRYGPKEYFISGGSEYLRLLEDPELECTVVHNEENRAMLIVENVRRGTHLFCQEINPLKYKDSGEWVADE